MVAGKVVARIGADHRAVGHKAAGRVVAADHNPAEAAVDRRVVQGREQKAGCSSQASFHFIVRSKNKRKRLAGINCIHNLFTGYIAMPGMCSKVLSSQL
jgi:hypothetical protein